LEVPEVVGLAAWRLHVHALKEGEYVRVARSELLPGLDLSLVERLAEHPYTSEALDEFERALAAQEG
jgi:hypothetical protein